MKDGVLRDLDWGALRDIRVGRPSGTGPRPKGYPIAMVFICRLVGKRGGGSGEREGADKTAGIAGDVRSHALSRPVKDMAREQMQPENECEDGIRER